MIAVNSLLKFPIGGVAHSIQLIISTPDYANDKLNSHVENSAFSTSRYIVFKYSKFIIIRFILHFICMCKVSYSQSQNIFTALRFLAYIGIPRIHLTVSPHLMLCILRHRWSTQTTKSMCPASLESYGVEKMRKISYQKFFHFIFLVVLSEWFSTWCRIKSLYGRWWISFHDENRKRRAGGAS